MCTRFVCTHVYFDAIENDLTMHKLFSIYKNDFGKEQTDSIVWASKFTRNLGSDIISNVKSGEVFIQYKEKFEVWGMK